MWNSPLIFGQRKYIDMDVFSRGSVETGWPEDRYWFAQTVATVNINKYILNAEKKHT